MGARRGARPSVTLSVVATRLRSRILALIHEPFDEVLGKIKGVGSQLPERPFGCFAQLTPDPFNLPYDWPTRLAGSDCPRGGE